MRAGAHQPERQAWPHSCESSPQSVLATLHLHMLQEPAGARPLPQTPLRLAGQPVRHCAGGVPSHHCDVVRFALGHGVRVLFGFRMSWMQE